MRRPPLDRRVLTRVGVLLLRGLVPRLIGLAALAGLVLAVTTHGRVLPVADPVPAPPLGQQALAAAAAAPAADGGRATPAAGPSTSAPAPSSRPSTSTAAPRPTPSPAAQERPRQPASAGRAELPRGGTSVFPRYRLVGFSGGPGSAAFGRLGIGDLDARGREIEQLAGEYAAGREPLPVFELITVVALPRPGADGLYRARIEPDVIRDYLAAARRHRALLLLNVQPGRADFLDEVKALEPWLRQPDVGLALDPEWAVGEGQVPGRVFGRTTGAELDRVARWVSDLVIANRLPDKVVVVHQLSPQVLREQQGLQPHYGVTMVKSVDGIGSREAKTSTWQRLVHGMPPVLHPGFKLFYDEDAKPLMTPAEVLALDPQPEYVLYE